MQCSTGFIKAATTKNGQESKFNGNLDASPACDHELRLNLRALGVALNVQRIAEENLGRFEARKSDLQLNCFNPAAPVPQYHFQLPHSNEDKPPTN